MIVKIYIGADRLDMFKDESIEVNSSVATINDISKNTTDYSKSFTVPASNNNNRIFKHYYDADIDNPFDARVKVAGRIELDGLPFKYGKWKLEKVSVKQGRPYAYTITFFGNLVSLNLLFGNDELTALDLSDYNFEYTSDNVITKLNSNEIVPYSLFANLQLFYNLASGGIGNLATTGVRWDALTPSIKLSALISAIELKYNINFSNDLFGRSEIADIFLLLSKDKDAPNGTVKQAIRFDSGNSDYVDFMTGVLNFNRTELITFRLFVSPATGYESTPYKVYIYRDDELVSVTSVIGEYSLTPYNNPQNAQYSFFIEAETFFYTATLRQTPLFGGFIYTYASVNNIISIFQIVNNLPKIKVIDFIKGISQLFKTVIIANEFDDIYINSAPQFYQQGVTRDITRYIDFNSYDVERGTILSQINFKFQEPQTILNKQFKQNTGIAYGDELTKLTDENGQPLDGDVFEVTIPFEQVLYEKLPSLSDEGQTSIQYGALIDDTLQPINPKPHLHYILNVPLGVYPMKIINSVGATQIINAVNIPNYANVAENENFNLLFSEEFGVWNGGITSNNLYSNYYKEYIESIFNIKKRVFRYKGFLPLNLLTKIKLNDVLKIKYNYYRIDNFTTNLVSGESSFTLVNNFENIPTTFNSNITSLNADFRNQTKSIYFSTLVDYSYTFDDSWIIFSSVVGNLIFFEFDENTTPFFRTTTGTVTNDLTGETITITFNQTGFAITADTNLITADTNLITADNG